VVTTGFGLEASFAAGAGLAVSGHPVAALCLFPLERAIRATFVPLVVPASFNQQTHDWLLG